MFYALLDDRGALRLAGEETAALLQTLVTNDVESLAPGEARFAALLTPQGKILIDFFVVNRSTQTAKEYWIDCPRDRLDDLLKRLLMYRLRAAVAIENRTSDTAVAARWNDQNMTADDGVWFIDPRRPDAGQRAFLTQPAKLPVDAVMASYDAHRIELGLPKGGEDFRYSDAFPHEARMEQLHGVDFRKGCYIGQEVVSRMQHRGTARNRVLRVGFEGAPPPPFAEIRAGEALLGHMGSAAGQIGLAMLRVDRVEEAVSAGVPFAAAGVRLELLPPA